MYWNTWFTNERLIEIGIGISILILFLLFRKIFTKYLYKFILKLLKKAPDSIFSKVWEAFEKPISWLFVIAGIYLSANFYFLETLSPRVLNTFTIAIIILITWGFYNLTGSSSFIFTSLQKRLHWQIDQTLVSLLSNILRFIVISIGLVAILDRLGINLQGFLAGLGLGGLAISLAAQDTIKNLIAGFVIIFEKTYQIGDWILTPSVEGTVEEITLRSTRIRTFEDALVTVPNSTLANEYITNWSKRGKRRIKFHLKLDFETTPEKIRSCVNRIKDLLENDPDIHTETIYVKFEEFGDSSFNVLLYFFTKTTVYEEFLTVKEKINLQILEILDEENVKLAYPAQKLYVDTETTREQERALE